VVILSPAFPAYAAQVKLAGGQAIRVPTREANRFHPDSEAVRAAIGKATKVLIINSPCNPTGAVYSRATLARLAELAVEKGLWLIADEVYEKILFDGAEHVSIGSLGTEIGARTITVNSVSKTHSMTGWRIGYAAMPRALAEAVTYLQSQSTSGPCSISQRAALVALTAPAAHAVAMAQEYARRRDYLLERLARIDELSCCRPEGAFYLFVNCGKLIGRRLAGRTVANSAEFAQVLLEEARIRVIAGAMYGSDCHVRFSFAVSMSALDEGMNRLENLLARRAGVVFTTPPPVSSSPTEPQPNGEN
jgi:aspartate aminotransferase